MRETPLADRPDLILLFDGELPDDEQVAGMVDRIDAKPELDAVGTGEPVTDAIKAVDEQARIVATLDRSKLVTLGLPAIVRRTVWEAQEVRSIGLV